VEQQFSEIVDTIGNEGSNAEMISTCMPFFGANGVEVDASEIEKGIAVICSKVLLLLCKV
jgi:hypothetical protein